ncbi:hypothetical protein VDGL01_05516 [Verticillium dahliae]
MSAQRVALPQEQELAISGSIVVARIATAEDVLTVLKEDIYSHPWVWDLKNVLIYPVLARRLLSTLTSTLLMRACIRTSNVCTKRR